MATNEDEDSPSVVKLIDYTISICRVCTLSTECQNIFETSYSDLTFADLFYYSTRIQLSADDNPYHICLMCIGKLLNAYKFIIQCEKSWYAQKQVRMSLQMGATTTATSNIIVVNSDNSAISTAQISQSANVATGRYYKPIAPKPAVVLDLTDDIIEATSKAPIIEAQSQARPLQRIVWVTNREVERNSLPNPVQEAMETNTAKQRRYVIRQNVKAGKSVNKDFRVTRQEKLVKSPEKENVVQLQNPFSEEKVVKSDHTTTPTNHRKLTKAVLPPNETKDQDLYNSDDSAVFEDILKELAEAEIDSNYEGSDGDLTGDERKRGNKEEENKPPYQCVKCAKEFQKIHSLNRHLLGHLSGGYTCRLCGEECPTQQYLRKHTQVHRKGRLICEHCGKIFKAAATLRNHQRRLHSQAARALEDATSCHICSAPVASPQELKAHVSQAHAERDHLCSVCGKTFLGGASLRKHMAVHDERRRVSCAVCGKVLGSRESLKQHVYTHTGVKPFQCHVCGRRFTQGQQLKVHIRVHTGDRPYGCQHCESAFATSTSLVTHVRARHTNVRPHVCDVCGKGFIQRPALRSHARTHARRRGARSPLVSCTLCGVIYATRRALLLHECPNLHLAPYACDVCGKQFRVKHLLTVHARIHTGERPFQCRLCPQAFRSNASLKDHTYRHTGEKRFVCDVCGKGCTQKQQLVSHMRTHTGARPYKCDVCGKAFAMKGNLTVHARIHTGETPYTCGDCGAGFFASNALGRHRAKCTAAAAAASSGPYV